MIAFYNTILYIITFQYSKPRVGCLLLTAIQLSYRMRYIILVLMLLHTSRAAIVILPDSFFDDYIFYENITEHIYCQSSVNVPGLTIQRPNQEPTTGNVSCGIEYFVRNNSNSF